MENPQKLMANRNRPDLQQSNKLSGGFVGQPVRHPSISEELEVSVVRHLQQ